MVIAKMLIFIILSQVVKSRIQGAEKVAGSVPKYNWTYPAYVSVFLFINCCFIASAFEKHYRGMRIVLTIGRYRLVTILREEGPAALYKGFVPKVLRLAPGGGVLLLVVEFTLSMFRKSESYELELLYQMCILRLFCHSSSRTSIHLDYRSNTFLIEPATVYLANPQEKDP